MARRRVPGGRCSGWSTGPGICPRSFPAASSSGSRSPARCWAGRRSSSPTSPTAELDSASADRVLDAFTDLAGEQVAFVLSSHDPRVVERSDHLLRLDRGRPVESW
jgi:hypothetical protein